MLLQFTHLTLYYYQLPQLPDTIVVININISGQIKTHISIEVSMCPARRTVNVKSSCPASVNHVSYRVRSCGFSLAGRPRAVDNALTLFRVWPFKNVGAILGHANAAVYAQRSG